MLRWGILLGCLITHSALCRPGDLVDGFKSRLPTNYQVTIAFEQSNGGLLVGGNITPVVGSGPFRFFLRLRRNGQIDKTFDAYRDGAWISDVTEVVERPDRRIGVIGEIFRPDGVYQNAALLFRDGHIDSTYIPATNFNSGTWLPDGRVAFGGVAPSGTAYAFSHSSFAVIRNLSADGKAISDGPWLASASLFRWLKALPDGQVVGLLATHLWSNGDIRSSLYSTGGLSSGTEVLRADGLRFPIGDGAPTIASIASGPSSEVYVGRYRFQSGAHDESFQFQFPGVDLSYSTLRIQAVTVQRDGKPVFAAQACYNCTNNLVFRCNSDGSVDTSFDVGRGSNGMVAGLLTLRRGDILAWGNFTEWNGKPAHGLARLKTR